MKELKSKSFVENSNVRNDPSATSMMQEGTDFESKIAAIREYNLKKLQIDRDFKKCKPFRFGSWLVIFFAICILIMSESGRVLSPINYQDYTYLWKQLLSEGSTMKTFASISDLQDHIYNAFDCIINAEEKLFMSVDAESTIIDLVFAKKDMEKYIEQRVPNNGDFGRENITSILKLPFDLNNQVETKEFFVNTYKFLIRAKKLMACYKRNGNLNCIETELSLAYVHADMQITCTAYVKIKHIHRFSKDDWFLSKFGEVGLFHFAVFIVSCIGIYYELRLLFLILLDQRWTKEFNKHVSIHFENEYLEIFSKKNKIEKHYLDFWFFSSLLQHSLFVVYYLTNVFSSSTTPLFQKAYEFFILFLFINVVKLIYMTPKLSLSIEVFMKTITQFTKYFVEIILLTVAFVLVGWLLFRSNDAFATLGLTWLTVYEMLVGDFVRDMLITISEFGSVGMTWGVISLTFFIFFLTIIYQTILIDSFQSIEREREEAAKTDLNELSENEDRPSENEQNNDKESLLFDEESTQFNLMDAYVKKMKDYRKVWIEKEADIFRRMKKLMKMLSSKQKLQKEFMTLYFRFLYQKLDENIQSAKKLQNQVS